MQEGNQIPRYVGIYRHYKLSAQGDVKANRFRITGEELEHLTSHFCTHVASLLRSASAFLPV